MRPAHMGGAREWQMARGRAGMSDNGVWVAQMATNTALLDAL